jgi:uncharacterized membrane protein
MRKGCLRNTAVFFIILSVIFLSSSANAEKPSDEKAKSFIDGIATVALFAAWPTATYKAYSFKAVRFADDSKYDIVFQIDAVSLWGNDIWLEVIVTVDSDMNISNIRWGDRKLGTLPPGTVANLVSEIIKIQNQKKQTYDVISFKNKCDDALYVAINYKDLNNEWVTKGWYSFAPGEEAIIAKTRNGVYYYYAEYKNKMGHTEEGPIRLQVRNSDVFYGFRQYEITIRGCGTWTHAETCYNW